MSTLHLLCAGAAQGLVKALQARFEAETGVHIQARFGAVGAMKEALLAGEPCDVMVLTQALIYGLVAEGRMAGGSQAALGRVRTGVAVRSGTPWPDVASAATLKAALLASSGVYVPDTVRSTAGIHIAKVLHELGVDGQLKDRLREFPNGATAMREMAASREIMPIGCTQVTEIKYTPGVELVGLLPTQFELATTYTAAVSTQSAQPALAAAFIALLVGADTRTLRSDGGFEF
ncbi:MAG: substrate-binding domain-containing protein [Rubrivivax sp.]|nr:substrate-binding domain-containing protein [Rubrivivax sp.]